jgi:enediyne biosynthesis protein E4
VTIFGKTLPKNIFIPFFVLAFSCTSPPETRFSKLDPSQTSIDFINTNNESEISNILSYEYFYNGGGVAAGDINNDGLTDLYFTSNQGENRLYLNEGDFHFKDITATSGTASQNGWKTGVSMVDVNADGFLDIYVCRSGPTLDLNKRSNQLFINNGDLTFKESAWRIRLNDPSYSTQAAFFDYDRDGDLDVFLLNHSLLAISNSFDITQKNTSKRQPYVGNRLLRNDNGKYFDVSDSSGVFGPASNYGLGISLSDINNDGLTDVYTGCDYTGRDKLLLNTRGGKFIDASDSMLSHISKFTMGTEIADVNNDGLMDIYTVDMLPEDNYRQKQLQGSDRYDEYYAMIRNGLHHQCMRNMLHLNNGDGTFSEVGQLMNVSNTDWSWASLFADFDNDGVLDLFVSNGFKRDLTNNDFAKFQASAEIKNARNTGKNLTQLDVIAKFKENKIPNYIFKGSLDSAFRNVGIEWGISEPTLTNGATYADLDNDGDLDLIMNNINEPAGIFRNNSEKLSQNNYLRIVLSAKGKNTSAIGAKATLHVGDKLFVREQFPVRGFQSSVDPVLHFGLGKIKMIDSLVVSWPDGNSQTLRNVSANQVVKVKQENSTPVKKRIADKKIFSPTSSGNPHFVHRENEFIDFREQRLLPRMYSREGPAMAQGDINNDGIIDYYFGGAANQPGEILIGKNDGTFRKSNEKILALDKATEDVAALFVDIDADKDIDLYVVTGGYEITDRVLLADRIYINDGKGNFSKGLLPSFFTNGACVKAGDVNADGLPELFIGGSVIHGKYPEADQSMVLDNLGGGRFAINLNIPEELRNAGIVSDAVWSDLNNDRLDDLIVVGEWMPIKVFMNEKNILADRSKNVLPEGTEGIWMCIESSDLDGDGDSDFVLGNYGLNHQMKASASEPLTLVYDDFDNNGSIDPILNYFIQHKEYPYPSRDELVEQLPAFRKRFTDYHSYSVAGLDKVLTQEELGRAKKRKAFMLQSCIMRNDNGRFSLIPLPKEAQMAPLRAIGVMDVNNDRKPDLITGGNISGGRARTGKMTGNYGFVFAGDGKGSFHHIPSLTSGISVSGDVRKIVIQGKTITFAVNNGESRSFHISER